MSKLVIRTSMNKTAANEDGPSFELQFGLLSDGVISDKYPKLNRMKLAFQVIEKSDDNMKACGASVFLVGKSVIFIPAFFKNGTITTGDMMFLAQTQQFLPLSDPWLSWLQNKDLNDSGTIIDSEMAGDDTSNVALTIKQEADPIIKTACVYLRGLLHVDPDLTKHSADVDLLDTVLTMGKTASGKLLDELVEDPNFLNASLHFYSAPHLDWFAKQAAALGETIPEVSVILPFTEEAKTLTPDEKDILIHDGYLIKRSFEEDSPDVIKYVNAKSIFNTISAPGKLQLALMDGTIKPCLVLRREQGLVRDAYRYGPNWISPFDTKAREYIAASRRTQNGFCVLTTEDATYPIDIPVDTVILDDANNQKFTPNMIAQYGVAANPSSAPEIGPGTVLLCPDGTAYSDFGDMFYAHNKGWCNHDGTEYMIISEDPSQKTPIVTKTYIIIPQKTRALGVIKPKETFSVAKEEKKEMESRHVIPLVTWSSLELFLSNYIRHTYHKVKMTSNGSEAYITGDKSNGAPMSVKEASLHIVDKYGVSPDIVRTMLHEVMSLGNPSEMHSETFLITKTASDDPWENSDIPYHEFENQPPTREFMSVPEVTENPEKLKQAIMTAADTGIKEVFDVTAFKLLLRQNRFLEEIHEDLPMFMKCLDSLCRKLFLLYWHTEDFKEQYGTIKLKSLEESLKNTIDSLSEITVFFKLRTVDGDLSTGQDGGDLMSGHDL